MEIKVLGPGCPKCGKVAERVRDSLAALGIAAEVEKVTDIRRMISYGITATPGLVIDGQVKSAGRVPRVEDIKLWIREAADRSHS
jgi:small redox-active disulfide protein 2